MFISFYFFHIFDEYQMCISLFFHIFDEFNSENKLHASKHAYINDRSMQYKTRETIISETKYETEINDKTSCSTYD